MSQEGKQLFECGDVLFDALGAYDEFASGQLSVIRNGEVFDKTSTIDWFGSHGACVCYNGLGKLFGEKTHNSVLTPEDFHVGDLIILDIPALPNFDFADFLRQQACFLSATLQAFEENPGERRLDELREDIFSRVSAIAGQFSCAKVVRFR